MSIALRPSNNRFTHPFGRRDALTNMPGISSRRALGVLLLLSAAACHPYGDVFQDQFNAGSADPFDFPPPYRGTTANGGPATRQAAGSGSFTERKATAHGTPANYFLFPFPPSLVATTNYAAPGASVDPLKLSTSLGYGYLFDPTGNPGDPVVDSTSCKAPNGYTYDQFRDDVDYSKQGQVFSALPAATFGVGSLPTWSYVPVVQRVPVTSNGEGCQKVITEKGLATRSDVTITLGTPFADLTPRAKPDGTLLAWAIIDPGSPVYRVGQTAANSPTGLNGQHWGWYNQFLIAYLDGGLVNTASTTVGAVTTTRMVAQELYYPRTGAAPNGLGAGNDLVEFARGEAGYQPICHVNSYTLPAGQTVPTDAVALRAAAAAAPAAWNLQAGAPISVATGAITPSYIFCLQAR